MIVEEVCNFSLLEQRRARDQNILERLIVRRSLAELLYKPLASEQKLEIFRIVIESRERHDTPMRRDFAEPIDAAVDELERIKPANYYVIQ